MTQRRGPSTTRVARGPPPHRCATGRIILLRGDDLERFLVQRMRQAAQHFLRADLPEAAAPAVPVGEDLGSPFVASGLGMVLEQLLEHRLPLAAPEPLSHDSSSDRVAFELYVGNENEGHDAGHAGPAVNTHGA